MCLKIDGVEKSRSSDERKEVGENGPGKTENQAQNIRDKPAEDQTQAENKGDFFN